MDAIQELLNINFSYVLISVFVILIGIKSIISIFEWVIEKLGLETKWIKKQREEHNLLIQTSQNLIVLKEKHEKDIEKSDRHDEELRKDIQKLTNMFIDKQIDDMRYEILDFASALSRGKKYSKEQFDHVIAIHEKYDEILREQKLVNGQVTASMDVINEIYKEKLKNGF